MFYHLILVRYAEGADGAFHQRIHDYCDEIAANLPGVRSYSYGADLVPGPFTHGIVGVYDSLEDYNAYWRTKLHDDLKAYMIQHVAETLIHDFDTTLRPVGAAETDNRYEAVAAGLVDMRGVV